VSVIIEPLRRPGARSGHSGAAARSGSERGDDGEEFAAVPDRGHTDADQIVGRQLRQHLFVDIIVTESGLVPFLDELRSRRLKQ